jgi:hypothetical protein
VDGGGHLAVECLVVGGGHLAVERVWRMSSSCARAIGLEHGQLERVADDQLFLTRARRAHARAAYEVDRVLQPRRPLPCCRVAVVAACWGGGERKK